MTFPPRFLFTYGVRTAIVLVSFLFSVLTLRNKQVNTAHFLRFHEQAFEYFVTFCITP